MSTRKAASEVPNQSLRNPHRPLTFGDHPVPAHAHHFTHIAGYFASVGNELVDPLWSGNDVAEDLTRSLLPWAHDIALAERRP